jgi:hypothetical protein
MSLWRKRNNVQHNEQNQPKWFNMTALANNDLSIKQEYIRAMRKTTREEKISRPAVYEVPAEGVQFMSISVDDYLKLSDDLALARMLIRELGDRLAKLEKNT